MTHPRKQTSPCLQRLCLSTLLLSLAALLPAWCQEESGATFQIGPSSPIAIIASVEDDEVIHIAAGLLAQDIAAITGWRPEVSTDPDRLPERILLVGTKENNGYIRDLQARGLIDLTPIEGQWERPFAALVENPFPKVKEALVLSGSDRRGAAYAAIEASRAMGVSPWVWWADAPPRPRDTIELRLADLNLSAPSVKYRGIFLNDELWGLRQWGARTQDKEIGDLGPKTYERIFELMLRLKANYLWPARHIAFNLYPRNALLADRYAIVRGGAHNSPILGNARKQWDEEKQGPWDYQSNPQAIRDFWKGNLRQFGQYENLYTIGMRGTGDLPMQGGANIQEKRNLLEAIIADQRKLLEDYYQRDAASVPQGLMLYKEVLDLYDSGMEVPDDVTLVWPDDNYGYMKRLPNPVEAKRPGGSGIYYHLSYLGRPHDYLWLSSTPPALIFEELKKAYDFSAKTIWVLNVGDIKPAEYEIQLGLDLAWNAESFDAQQVQSHLRAFFSSLYGEDLAAEIVSLKNEFHRLAFSRRPEFMGWDRLEPRTPVKNTEFSLVHYGEAERRITSNRDLLDNVEALSQRVQPRDRSSFYQLVYYPIAGSALMNLKHLYAQKQRLYAAQGRPDSSQIWADQSTRCHEKILQLSERYESLEDGKWVGMASYQDMPFPVYKLPPFDALRRDHPDTWALWATGNEEPGEKQLLSLSDNGSRSQAHFEIFRRDAHELDWEITSQPDWIQARSELIAPDATRIHLVVDWSVLAPGEAVTGDIVVTARGQSKRVAVTARKPSLHASKEPFHEVQGVISIPAEGHSHIEHRPGFAWTPVDELGYTATMMTTRPLVTLPIDHEWNVADNAARLEYKFVTESNGWFDIISQTLPTHPINNFRKALYAISIDDQPPLIVDFSTKDRSEEWKQNVLRNASLKRTRHYIDEPGEHTLKVWQIEPGVYFDRFILDFGGLADSYIGPSP